MTPVASKKAGVDVVAALNEFIDGSRLDELGLKGFSVAAWHAMWAPKGLPQPVLEKLNAALRAAVSDPKVVERLSGLGADPVPAAQVTPAALKEHLGAEIAKWGQVIKAAGVKGN